MNQLMVLLPMLFVMGKIDFENPMVLLGCRCTFFGAAAAVIIAHFMIKSKVQAKDDKRPIWIPVRAPLQSEPSSWQRTTYQEHELAQVQKGLQGVYSAVGISALLHFYMGVNPPLLLQTVMLPFKLFESPLFKMYVLGTSVDKPWDESLTEPASGGDEEKEGEGDDEGVSLDTLMLTLMDMRGDAAVKRTDVILSRVRANRELANYRMETDGERWTPLMVMCGNTDVPMRAINQMLEWGARVTDADKDGWTAMHWGCFHGRPDAVEVLAAHLGAGEEEGATLEAVLASEDKEGKKPVELCADDDARSKVEAALAGAREAASAAVKAVAEAEASPEGSDDDVVLVSHKDAEGAGSAAAAEAAAPAGSKKRGDIADVD